MKTRIFILLLMALAADAALSPTAVQRYRAAFSADDGLALVGVSRQFELEVSTGDRAEALTQLWDSTPTSVAVRQGVMNYLVVRADHIWNAGLAERLTQAAKSTDPETRRVVINVWKLRPVNESRGVVTLALDDASEKIRIQALRVVRTWPDAQTVLATYVQDHGTDRGRATSVWFAQNVLKEKSR